MKRFLLMVMMVMVLGVGVSAEEVKVTGCTLDKHLVGLELEVVDGSKVEVDVAVAFEKAASSMELEKFMGSEGFYAFLDAVGDKVLESVIGFHMPEVLGVC